MPAPLKQAFCMQATGPKKPSSPHRDKYALTKDEQGAEGGAQRREPARTISVLICS